MTHEPDRDTRTDVRTDVDDRGSGDERTLTDLVGGDTFTAMVMTMVGREHTSRPVACADVGDHRLSFLVDRRAMWVEAIVAGAALVHVTVAEDDRNIYLSLNGAATVVTDPTEITRLWNPNARAWFDGPDDPDLAVLHFDVSGGEYWSGVGGRVGRAVAMLWDAFGAGSNEVPAQGPVAGDGTSLVDLDHIVPHRVTEG